MGWRTCSCGKHSHWVFFQEKDYSCVIACMLMAMQRKGRLNTAGMTYRRLTRQQVVNRPITAPELRQASQQFGGPGYYRPGARDAGAQVDDPRQARLAAILTAQLGTAGSGTGFNNAVRTLRRLGFNADHFRNVAWKQALAFVQHYVVIGQVRWRGGGLHAVVLENLAWKNVATTRRGKNKTVRVPASVCVCDPAVGATPVVLPPDGAKPVYRPRAGVAAQFTGDILVI